MFSRHGEAAKTAVPIHVKLSCRKAEGQSGIFAS
jgi:hypothetical protein